MTHDEMKTSLPMIFLKIDLMGLGIVEKVFNELPVPLNVIRVVTDNTVESSRSVFKDEAKPGVIHYWLQGFHFYLKEI